MNLKQYTGPALRVYISGQINGLDEKFARLTFEQHEKIVADLGHQAINPFKILPQHPGMSYKEYMLKDINELFDCEAIYLLDNWKVSRGARIEMAIAVEMGFKIFYA